MTPALVGVPVVGTVVFCPCTSAYVTVLPCASLMKRMATPVADTLVMVSWLVVPTPPGLPSMITFFAPLKSTVAVLLLLKIERPVAPAAGLMVMLLVEFEQATKPSVRG